MGEAEQLGDVMKLRCKTMGLKRFDPLDQALKLGGEESQKSFKELEVITKLSHPISSNLRSLVVDDISTKVEETDLKQLSMCLKQLSMCRRIFIS